MESIIEKRSREQYDLSLSANCIARPRRIVTVGMYPLEEEDACHLGALQLQATHGLREQSFYVPGIVQDVIDRYVPYIMLQTNNASQCESKILAKHAQYKHLDKQDAYRKYIEYLRKSNA